MVFNNNAVNGLTYNEQPVLRVKYNDEEALFKNNETRLLFTLTSELTQSLYFTQTAANAITIDWGDGSQPDNPSNVSGSVSHTYSEAGTYMVTINCVSGQGWSPGCYMVDDDTTYGLVVGVNLAKLATNSTLRSAFMDATNDSYTSSYGLFGCSQLTHAYICDGAPKIPGGFFQSCTQLTDVRVPDSITSIGNASFQNCAALQHIDLPNGVDLASAIGGFSNCSALEYFNVPSGTSWIPDSFFAQCRSLKQVYIPNSVTHIGSSAFMYCEQLSSVYMPSVTQIGSKAFGYCWALESFDYPSGAATVPPDCFIECIGLKRISFTSNSNLSYIDSGAFNTCSELTSIAIPNTVIGIGSKAFYACGSLSQISLPQNNQLASIPAQCFSGCGSLTDIQIPEGVQTIQSLAFENCFKLYSLSLPTTLRGFGAEAFKKCLFLQSMDVPNGVLMVSAGCFSGCASLSLIHLPASITEIRGDAFKDCVSIRKLICDATTPPTFPSGTTPLSDVPSAATIYVPDSAVETYKAATGWSDLSDQIAPKSSLN